MFDDWVDFDFDFFDLGDEQIDGLPAWAVDFPVDAEFPTAPILTGDPEWDALVHAYQMGDFDPSTISPGELEHLAAGLGLEIPGFESDTFQGDVDVPLGMASPGFDTGPAGAGSAFEGQFTGDGGLPLGGGSASEGQFTGAGDLPLGGVTNPAAEIPAAAAAMGLDPATIEQKLGDLNRAVDVATNGLGIKIDSTTGAAVLGNGQPVEPGLWTQIQEHLKPFSEFIATPIGRLATTLALGGAGVGLSALLAGGTPTMKTPAPPPPTPQVQAGQDALLRALNGGRPGTTSSVDASIAAALLQNPAALAALFGPGASGVDDLSSTVSHGIAGQRNVAAGLSDQAARERLIGAAQSPQEAAIRSAALEMLPRLLDPSIAAILAQDPLAAAAYAQALNATVNPATNPMLEQQFEKEERDLRQMLYRNIGPGYETSTPGIQALQEMRAKHAATRAQDARAQATTFATLTQGRESAAQGVRQNAVAQNVGISQGLGRAPLTTTGAGLNSIVPTMPLLGIDQTNQDRSVAMNLNNQAAISNFNADAASRAATANSIASIFGRAASTVGGGTTLRRNTDGSFTLG